MRLFGRGWYHWLLKDKRGGLKAKFEGLNFPELLKLEKTKGMIKSSVSIEKYGTIEHKGVAWVDV